LLDTLSAADGQEWPDLFENPELQEIAESMYGRQADGVLASSWLADALAAAEARGYQRCKDEAIAVIEGYADCRDDPCDETCRDYCTGWAHALDAAADDLRSLSPEGGEK